MASPHIRFVCCGLATLFRTKIAAHYAFFTMCVDEGFLGATILGVLGVGVPPLLGTLALLACWGALDAY